MLQIVDALRPSRRLASRLHRRQQQRDEHRQRGEQQERKEKAHSGARLARRRRPAGAFAIGIVSGTACFFGATTLKRWGGYDDSLDAFGVHGVGGLLGTILVGIFAAERFGGQVKDLDIARQLGVQALCAAITMVWSVAITFALLKILDRAVGLRAEEQDERTGLDLSLHNESGYNL